MYIQSLKNIMTSRSLSQADVARLAQVSRAAVCKWFTSKSGIANVETRTLLTLANGLDVSPGIFLQEQIDLSSLSARFLWDRLYPTMEEFALALVRQQLPAMARLVQVLGFLPAAKVAGPRAITLFPSYRKFLKPSRHAELETLWPLYSP
jgi:transcriptional regulator with XRE-family HTH domain